MTKDKIAGQSYKQARIEAEKIFRARERFHQDQARLPIEEKIRLVVELQKIVFEIKKGDPFLKNKVIWEI